MTNKYKYVYAVHTRIFSIDIYLYIIIKYYNYIIGGIEMHIYESNGVKLPSVTTITGFITLREQFEALMKWSNFLGFKHKKYMDVLNTKADFGSAVHENIHALLTNTEPNPEVISKVKSIEDIFNLRSTMKIFDIFLKDLGVDISNTIFSEESIASEKLGYVGTVDWVVKMNSKVYLIDFKTSSTIHESMGLQLSAYRQLLLEEKGIKIDMAAILLLNEKRYKLIEYRHESLNEYYAKFSMIKDLFYTYIPYMECDENSLITIDPERNDIDEIGK